jgi:hypothetical protein
MTGGAWLWVALALSLTGYGTYLLGLRRHLVEPNRASWLIWAAATGVEAATYFAVNPGAPQGWIFSLSAAACLVITLAMWRRSRWTAPSATESLCMGASLAALLLWIAFAQAFWAHMLVVVAVPISFWPTWRGVWEDRARERSPAWGLWTLGDLATLVLATRVGGFGVGQTAYLLVELGCHAAVWLMVGLPSINPLRSLGRAQGRLLVLDALGGGNPFRVGETHLGKAVFAREGFAAGDSIVRFSGRRVSADRLRAATGSADRFVQVAPDAYLGPSGRVDDLINHSCDPNAGLRFTDGGVFLVALRPIAAGEEIAWDYSTTLADESWRMICECGAPDCRGVIGAFAGLPEAQQRRYRELGVVPSYLLTGPAREQAA